MNKPLEIAPLDQRLCFALYSCSQAIVRRYQPYLSKLGMTYPQYLVYITLQPIGNITVNALGAKLHLDSGTLSPLLKRMEQAGLVTRRRHSEDERKVSVELTERARSLGPAVANMQHNVACSTQLTKKESQALLSQLHQLNDTLREQP